MKLDNIPEHILIIGGGYIGIEFAQALRRFGSRVTIIERKERLAPREDTDVSELLHELCHEHTKANEHDRSHREYYATIYY